MIRRAFHGIGARRGHLLSLVAMGSAALLLGCGGGGGGGGTPPPSTRDCGSPSTSSNTVICGYVVNPSNAVVSGATVTFKNAAGATIGSPVTTNSSGYYVFTIPSSAASGTVLMKVVPPTPYYDNTMTFRSTTYAYYVAAQAGGECIPALAFTTGTDTRLGTVTVYDDSVPPPYPAYPCPR